MASDSGPSRTECHDRSPEEEEQFHPAPSDEARLLTPAAKSPMTPSTMVLTATASKPDPSADYHDLHDCLVSVHGAAPTTTEEFMETTKPVTEEQELPFLLNELPHQETRATSEDDLVVVHHVDHGQENSGEVVPSQRGLDSTPIVAPLSPTDDRRDLEPITTLVTSSFSSSSPWADDLAKTISLTPVTTPSTLSLTLSSLSSFSTTTTTTKSLSSSLSSSTALVVYRSPVDPPGQNACLPIVQHPSFGSSYHDNWGKEENGPSPLMRTRDPPTGGHPAVRNVRPLDPPAPRWEDSTISVVSRAPKPCLVQRSSLSRPVPEALSTSSSSSSSSFTGRKVRFHQMIVSGYMSTESTLPLEDDEEEDAAQQKKPMQQKEADSVTKITDPPLSWGERQRDAMLRIIDHKVVMFGVGAVVLIGLGVDAAFFIFLLLGFHHMCEPRTNCEPRNWWFNFSLQILTLLFTYLTVISVPRRVGFFIHLMGWGRDHAVGLDWYGRPTNQLWYHIPLKRRTGIIFILLSNCTFGLLNQLIRWYYYNYERQAQPLASLLLVGTALVAAACAGMGGLWTLIETEIIRRSDPAKFGPDPVTQAIVLCRTWLQRNHKVTPAVAHHPDPPLHTSEKLICPNAEGAPALDGEIV